ncbi:MAG: glycoside hydrolase family 75 protein [Akkermansiaceae bacterium]
MASPTGNQRKHDPHEIEGVNKKPSKVAGFPWLRVSFFIMVVGAIIIAQGPLPGKIWRKLNSMGKEAEPRQVEKKESKTSDPVVTTPATNPIPQPPTPPKPPDPPKVVVPTNHTATSGSDIRKMSKGFELKTKVTLVKGKAASIERNDKASYVAEYELKLRLPEAIKTLEELKKVNPGIDKALPGLKDILPTAKVSPFYFRLYENKTNRLKKNATRLNELMTKHNFYDCETMLNLKSPKTGRRALLVQAEMDVVSDGSDGDRLPVMPDKIVNSSYYQPMTSYGWRKTGKTPNPLIAGWKKRIEKANAELARAGTKADRKAWLRARIKKIKREIEDMEARSYLIADYDPFIVMPINMVTDRSDKYAASVGDYAVVIHKGKIYPSIVGDAGPSFKVGEASLRVAKQINSRASSYSRPVSDLTVTYIVFPGSAEKFKAPDYAHWREKCSSLLAEIGGIGAESTLHTWANTLPIIEKTDP